MTPDEYEISACPYDGGIRIRVGVWYQDLARTTALKLAKAIHAALAQQKLEDAADMKRWQHQKPKPKQRGKRK
jgi:hypothetical protein